MTAAKRDFIIEQGSTWIRAWTWKSPDINGVQQPVDLQGYTAKMQIRLTAENPALIAELNSSTGEISLTGVPGASFVGSCAGNVLTVVSITSGALALNQVVYRASGTPFATISALGTGTGGVGTYTLTANDTFAAEAMTTSIGGIALKLTSVQTEALSFAGAPLGQLTEGKLRPVTARGRLAVYDIELTIGTAIIRHMSGNILLSTEVTR